MGSSFSVGSDIRIDCTTLLSARPATASIASVNPSTWKLGSPPLAIITPTTTGTRAMYVVMFSRAPWKKYANKAVKKGVVAPIACVKDTCRYLRDAFPSTMVEQKMTARMETLTSCILLFRGLTGIQPEAEMMMPRNMQAVMWHSVRNTGCLNPVLDSRNLFPSSTRMLVAYQMMMTEMVVAVLELDIASLRSVLSLAQRAPEIDSPRAIMNPFQPFLLSS
mmetsp:Transcript_16340/g.42745  ORF Transcript_16340/g.42745 Transcript_16340/m.42745 type:complete len:221 (-) Transcript_16340:4-666(-)